MLFGWQASDGTCVPGYVMRTRLPIPSFFTILMRLDVQARRASGSGNVAAPDATANQHYTFLQASCQSRCCFRLPMSVGEGTDNPRSLTPVL